MGLRFVDFWSGRSAFDIWIVSMRKGLSYLTSFYFADSVKHEWSLEIRSLEVMNRSGNPQSGI